MRDISKIFYTHEKLRKFMHDVSPYRYRQRISIDTVQMLNSHEQMRKGDTWIGRDKYIWVTFDIEVPMEFKDKTVLFRFDFGQSSGGNNAGFESLCYIDEVPYQGVDEYHKEVFLKQDHIGKNINVKLHLWSGLNGRDVVNDLEHRFKMAELCVLDDKVDEFYFTAKAILEVLELIDPSDYAHVELENSLNSAYQLVEWTNPGSEDFYQSLYKGLELLNRKINQMEKRSHITINCIGHTHIDVAWLWRLKHTREKASRSFSTVIRLMEKFPDYIFVQSQPQLYEFIKQDFPMIYEQIKEVIKSGQWEANGAMWVEADCNIPSGESLVRQILYGKQFFKNEFNVDANFLWLPDVFGYSWALPQILKKSGIDSFITSKISWNQYNRMPHDTFKWKGIDGSEILTYFLTTPGEHDRDDSWYSIYNTTINAKSVKKTWDKYVDKHINQELILPYGYGDGGGGVNREMLEMRRRFEKLVGMPQVKTRQVSDVLKDISHHVENTDQYVHTWDGELYLEYHRGTYTSQAKIKKYNRKLELLYRETELYGVLTALRNKNWNAYDKQGLDTGWKIILTNQFHDIIPGSSIREVYEDAVVDYQKAEKFAVYMNQANKKSFVQNEDKYYTVFNNSHFNQDRLLELKDIKEKGYFVDLSGNSLPSQQEGDTYYVRLNQLPALGYTSIQFVEGENNTRSSFELKDEIVVTPFYEVVFHKGQIKKLYDKEAKRDVLIDKGNVLRIYEDKPMNYDAWDIDIYYKDKYDELTECTCEVIEKGNLRFVLRIEYVYNRSTITQEIIFYAFNKRIDFKTVVNWQERQKLIKVSFPVNIRSTKATYDIQYGNVERPTHHNTSWDLAKFEVVGHQWADLSEGNYGVSLLNDCKYGYSIKDQVMELSLLKGAIIPDPTADIGIHEYTYALLPHKHSWKEAQVVEEAWDLNNPLTYVEGRGDTSSLFQINDQGIMVDAIKKAENSDDIIMRLHDYKGERKQVKITSDFTIDAYCECDLMENKLTEYKKEKTIAFEIKPYEIKTFMVKFK